MQRLPTVFVSHGAPTLPLEAIPARDFLAALGEELPRPRAVLAVSAHWLADNPAVSAAPQPETIHDFHGFPAELYQLRYPARGDTVVAERVRALLDGAGFAAAVDGGRGLDHGAWVPLMLMYPGADVPVIQLALQPSRGPAHHLRLGAALAPLRDEGVLILGSGGATHNLREFRGRAPADALEDYAAAFAHWLAQAVECGDRAALGDYRQLAPHAVRNHPTEEHLLPLHVTAGAAYGPGRRIHASASYGVLAMDAYRFD
ncbi:MAG TPA: class III extradiol ring-cleavage dioxygenase [Pelomicrobium sp.]|nr:class III extradiol ring-cleavage dioxygenase [Pelomicrobium sp.]